MKTKKSRPKKRSAKQAWVQQTHQWRKDIFVCTGYSAKEIVAGIRKIGAKDWMLKYCDENEKEWQDIIDAGCAFVSREPRHGAIVMRLRPYQDTWEYWETLIHELNHGGSREI